MQYPGSPTLLCRLCQCASMTVAPSTISKAGSFNQSSTPNWMRAHGAARTATSLIQKQVSRKTPR